MDLGFILVSLAVYVTLGMLRRAVFAGGFSGLVLPIDQPCSCTSAGSRQAVVGRPLLAVPAGGRNTATALSWYMAVVSIVPIFQFLGR